MYYLVGRYYDFSIGVFISADKTYFIGKKGSLTSFNLYKYCCNDPISKVDVQGNIFESVFQFFKSTFLTIGTAMNKIAPAYAACGSAVVIDGPFPFGDVLGLAAIFVLSIGPVGYGIAKAALPSKVENGKNGSHYHILDMEKGESHMGLHYWPGDPIPEPWNTLYFGGAA